MTEKSAALKPKGKKVTLVDAFKQNCAEFGDDDWAQQSFVHITILHNTSAPYFFRN